MRRYDFAVVGFGNVGRALARHFLERRELVRKRFDVELRLAGVVDRASAVVADGDVDVDVEALARAKESGKPLAGLPGARPAPRHDPADALRFFGELRAGGVAGIVIALPTDLERGEPGLTLARAALDSGMDVILADKGPALFALSELEERAAKADRFLGTSGTTGSALPSMSQLRGWFAAGRVDEIAGILNGTSNLILSRLREPGATYASALMEAQRLGIAEPDPRLDVEGWDTAVKLVILTRGLIDPDATLAAVERTGITDLPEQLLGPARAGHARLRLVGRAQRVGRRAHLTVAPELVPPEDPLFGVDGTEKAIRFFGQDLGEMTLVGGASSRTGTAWALLRDLIAAARARR